MCSYWFFQLDIEATASLMVIKCAAVTKNTIFAFASFSTWLCSPDGVQMESRCSPQWAAFCSQWIDILQGDIIFFCVLTGMYIFH